MSIQTRKDLREFIQADADRYDSVPARWPFVWRFSNTKRLLRMLYEMRYAEYCRNANKKLRFLWHYYWFKTISRSFCSEIGLNTCGKGLMIFHGYRILINDSAHVGDNFTINTGCIVGGNHGLSPTIGNNVTMNVDSHVLGGGLCCGRNGHRSRSICISRHC